MAKYNAKLTPELSARLCEALEKGHSIEAACAYAGIVRQTFHNWYNKGLNAKSGKFKQFVCDVDNAQDNATLRAEEPIIDAIPTDVKTAQWWLAKRRHGLYGDRTYNETKLEADVKTELLAKLERPLPELKEDD